MEEFEVDFSRKELKNFLRELADHVNSGKVGIQIPSDSGGKMNIAPEQPISVFLERDDEGRELTIKIEFEDKREVEV